MNEKSVNLVALNFTIRFNVCYSNILPTKITRMYKKWNKAVPYREAFSLQQHWESMVLMWNDLFMSLLNVDVVSGTHNFTFVQGLNVWIKLYFSETSWGSMTFIISSQFMALILQLKAGWMPFPFMYLKAQSRADSWSLQWSCSSKPKIDPLA